MSTVVVVRKGNKAVIGADSLFCQGTILIDSSKRANHLKIHKAGDAYVGFVGWSVMHNIFEDILEKFPKALNFEGRKNIFRTFVFLHSKIKELYFIETREKNDQPVESSQWDCLIACPQGIYGVDSYRTVIEYSKYWADGSGMRFALGAMNAVYDREHDPAEIARIGLLAACDLDDGSAQPIYIQEVNLNCE